MSEAPQEPLRTRVFRAAGWSFIIGLAGSAFRFGSSLILTRLLVPEVFGVVLLATTFYLVIALISDIGIRQFIVSSPHGEDKKYLETALFVSIIRGFLITLGCEVLAVVFYVLLLHGRLPADSVYAHPQFALVFFLTAATAAISGFKSPKIMLLERRLDAKRLGYIELFSQLSGTLFTIPLAYWWRSIWPIVIGSYVTSIATVLLSMYWIEGRNYRPSWHKECASQIFHYGKWIALSTLCFVVAVNADRMVLGIWATPAALGIYMVALNFIQTVEQMVGKPAAAVAMPAFGEVARRDMARLKQAYLKVKLFQDGALLLAAAALFASGDWIISIYDDRWAAAGGMLQVLSFSLVFVRYGLISSMHTAIGDTKTGFYYNLTKLATILIAIPVGNHFFGLTGAVWGIALHLVPSSVISVYINGKYGLNDLRTEFLVLLGWPAGFLLGWVGELMGRAILAAWFS